MKNIDVAVLNLGKTIIDGTYKGGELIVNTLDMDGVGIAPTSKKNVAPDVLEYVKGEAEKIKSGDIKVPQNEKEYKELKK
jgi:basic membrane protein A